MKPEEQNEDELQRMLSLKRREQPPPTFFRGFAEKIIDRLHKPDPPSNPTWWQRLGLDFDAKPVLVCAAGVAVCALLVYGLISARHVDPPAPSQGDVAQDIPVPVGPIVGQAAQPIAKAPRLLRPEEMPRSVDPAIVADPSAPSQFTVRPQPAPLQSGSGQK
jgi:hypothetical protein